VFLKEPGKETAALMMTTEVALAGSAIGATVSVPTIDL
jgi:hypothetical protein